jgi:hypothetical protein
MPIDPIVSKSKDRVCAAIAQSAAMIVSDATSTYWSVVDGKPIPGVFLAQMRNRLETIKEMLDFLEAKEPSNDKPKATGTAKPRARRTHGDV